MSFDFTPSALFAINHLRYRKLWLAIGLLLIMLVILVSVVSIPTSLKVVILQDKLMHTLTYVCLMGWFSQIYRHDLTRLLLAIGLVSMGVTIEFVQGMIGSRQFEVLDMVANTSGVLLAWALAYTWVGTLLVRVEAMFHRRSLGS